MWDNLLLYLSSLFFSQTASKQGNNNNLSKFEKQLTKEDPTLLEGIPIKKKKEIISSSTSTIHASPLPDPETLNKYSALIPNGADRIMQMAEKQLDHRIRMENKVFSLQMLQSNIGQVLFFYRASGFRSFYLLHYQWP